MSSESRSATASLRNRVLDALDRWPEDSGRRELVALASRGDREHQDAVAYALARCGRRRRPASLEFLETYERDPLTSCRRAASILRFGPEARFVGWSRDAGRQFW